MPSDREYIATIKRVCEIILLCMCCYSGKVYMSDRAQYRLYTSRCSSKIYSTEYHRLVVVRDSEYRNIKLYSQLINNFVSLYLQ